MEFFYEFLTLLFGADGESAQTEDGASATTDNIVWSMSLRP